MYHMWCFLIHVSVSTVRMSFGWLSKLRTVMDSFGHVHIVLRVALTKISTLVPVCEY